MSKRVIDNHFENRRANPWKTAQIEFVGATISAPFYIYSTGVSCVKKGEVIKKSGILNQFSGFSWSLSGALEMYDGPKRILAGPNHVHFNFCGEDTWSKVISDECVYRWVSFAGPLADAVLLSYRYARHQVAQHPYPAQLFERLDSMMNNDSPLQTRIKTAIVLEILAYAAGVGYGVGENRRLIDNALALIEQHLSDSKLGVPMLCEQLKTSAATLNRAFQEHLQVSPGRHILNERLRHGMGLLAGTDLAIGAIAEKCGFNEAKTFSRFIRRATGCSARDFRKEQRSGGGSASFDHPVIPVTPNLPLGRRDDVHPNARSPDR